MWSSHPHKTASHNGQDGKSRMRVDLEFEISDPDASVIYRALQPEVMTTPSERSCTGLIKDDPGLRLTIDAEDLVSLRASINTWLRLVKIAEDMINILECEV